VAWFGSLTHERCALNEKSLRQYEIRVEWAMALMPRNNSPARCAHRGRERFRRADRADQNARHFEGVVHLVTKGMEPPSRMKTAFLPKPFPGVLCFFENRIVVGSYQGFPLLKTSNLQWTVSQELSNVLFHEFGDLVRILVGTRPWRI